MKHNIKPGNYSWRQYPTSDFYPCIIHAVSDEMAIISEDGGKQFAVYISHHAFIPQDCNEQPVSIDQIKSELTTGTVSLENYLRHNFAIYRKLE